MIFEIMALLSCLPAVTVAAPMPSPASASLASCGTQCRSKWAVQVLCDAAALSRCTPELDPLWTKSKCIRILESLEQEGSRTYFPSLPTLRFSIQLANIMAQIGEAQQERCDLAALSYLSSLKVQIVVALRAPK
jgi:hypothetical protein